MYHCSKCNHSWKYDGSYKKNNPCFHCGKLYQKSSVTDGELGFVEYILVSSVILCFTGVFAGVAMDSIFITASSLGSAILVICYSLLHLFSLNNKSFEETSKDIKPLPVTNLCESPIEEALYGAMLTEGLNPEPQKQIGIYRVDFLIGKLVIECDGHDFHKTKEQRTRDAAQRRYLMSKGYKVINFTGTEIHNNKSKCAKEVKKLLYLSSTN